MEESAREGTLYPKSGGPGERYPPSHLEGRGAGGEPQLFREGPRVWGGPCAPGGDPSARDPPVPVWGALGTVTANSDLWGGVRAL